VRIFSSTGEASNSYDYLYLMSLANYQAPVIEYCGGTEIGGGHLTGTVLQPASPATFTTPAMGLDFVLMREDGVVAGPGMGEMYLVPPSIGLSQRLLHRDHDAEYYADCPAGPGGVTLRRHGDEVERLPQGFYLAQGRADDTMNLGGIKVSSIELERVMNKDLHVFETAAVGIAPASGGAQQLVVFVVPAPGLPSVDQAGLKAALQARIKSELNPLFRIHELVVVETLPRTASNKVMRRSLRSEFEALRTATV
jgi:acetyl-CoA synthetase